jgi:prepilin-type N-terminal cleavage/methylation domain-containing protein
MKKTATPKPLPHRNRGGFTLLETLIGLVIFSIGIMAMAGLQVQSIRNNSLARTSSDNTNTALATVERISSMSLDSHMLDMDWPIKGKTAKSGSDPPQGNFKVQWSVTSQTASGGIALANDMGKPAALLISVTSSYVDKAGAVHSSTLNYIKPRI